MVMDKSDRIAAMLMRRAGVPLSTQEYRDGITDGLGADAPNGLMPAPVRKKPPILGDDGTVNMTAVLAELLAACGVDVSYADDELEFKRQLCAACLQKIGELTGKAPAQGKGSSPATNTNPLIPGNKEPIPPIYMSVELTHERADAATAALLRQMGIHN